MYPSYKGVQLTPAPGRSAWGVPFPSKVSHLMAGHPPPIQFEDVPLEEARRMGRGPRMEPLLYDTLRQKIQSLSTDAARIRLGPEIRPARMKNYLLRIARELNVPVTVRKVPGGVVFWRASEEDQEQAQAVSERLRGTRAMPQAPRRDRPRRA
jgi:hypothetical protein